MLSNNSVVVNVILASILIYTHQSVSYYIWEHYTVYTPFNMSWCNTNYTCRVRLHRTM